MQSSDVVVTPADELIAAYRQAIARQERAEREAAVEIGAAADVRAMAVAAMHAGGMSLAQIARALGLSRARAQQLVKRGRQVTTDG